MSRMVFHVGFGKTGTSSLQSFLSRHAAGRLGNSPYVYCALEADGNIRMGEELASKARRSTLGYVSSAPSIALTANTQLLRTGLADLAEQGIIPVCSQEDWSRRGNEFLEANFFEAIDCDVEVIAYVRPQVDWFNAGWWQWFTWDDRFNAPRDVIDAWGCHFLKWAAQIKRWKGISRVSNVRVRLHQGSVIDDFLRLLEISGVPEDRSTARINTSLSPLIIKLYKAIPALRSIHGGEMDSVLSKYLKSEEGAPWVVTPDLAETIVEQTSFDNMELLKLLDKDQADIMKGDLRWWDSKSYEGRKLMDEKDAVLSREDCILLLSRLVPLFAAAERNATEVNELLRSP